MSTATAPERSHAPYAEPDEYIDYQLRKTQTGIKRIDMLTATIVAITVLIGYVLLFVLSDHWLFEGGVGSTARVLMFLPVIGFVGWLIGAKVIWPALRNVSGLYAARTLEASSTEFRSGLLNLVDLKQAGREVSPLILATMEKRAAVTLAKFNVDDAIDKRPLLRTLCVLFGIVVVFCAYSIFSPKKLGPSVLRAIVPFTNVTPATQTEILEVKPGDAKLRAGGILPVSVQLRGEIPADVTLLFTTADRRFVDEPVQLGATTDLTLFEGTLGNDEHGLLQSFSYHVVAGDARSPEYQVEIVTPPSATVTEVRYDYPEYTELDPRTQMGGAIDVWERTAITITAATNVPIKRGEFELADTEDFSAAYPGSSVKISDGKTLTIAWRADPRQADGKFPKFYRIKVWDAEDTPDPKPAVYPINVRVDQPPQVVLIDPTTNLEVPANATIPLVVAARDQDFKLRTVSLKIARDENDVTDEELFNGSAQEVGPLKYDFALEPLRLKAGDKIRIWVEAQDNRLPTHNLAKTPPIEITIRDKVSKEEAKKQLEQEKKEQQKRLDEAAKNNDQPNDPNEPPPSEPRNPAEQPSRDPNEREQPKEKDDEPKADQSQQKGQPQDDKSAKGQDGSSDKSQKGGEGKQKDADSNGKSDKQQAGEKSDSSDGKSGQRSLKSDGSQDQEALEKIAQRAKKEGQLPKKSEQQSPSTSDKREPQENSTGESTDNPTPDGSSKPKSQDGSKSKDGNEPKNAGGSKEPKGKSPREGDEPKPGDKNAVKPDGTGKEPNGKDDKNADGSKKPMPNDGPGQKKEPSASDDKGDEKQGNKPDAQKPAPNDKAGNDQKPSNDGAKSDGQKPTGQGKPETDDKQRSADGAKSDKPSNENKSPNSKDDKAGNDQPDSKKSSDPSGKGSEDKNAKSPDKQAGSEKSEDGKPSDKGSEKGDSSKKPRRGNQGESKPSSNEKGNDGQPSDKSGDDKSGPPKEDDSNNSGQSKKDGPPKSDKGGKKPGGQSGQQKPSGKEGEGQGADSDSDSKGQSKPGSQGSKSAKPGTTPGSGGPSQPGDSRGSSSSSGSGSSSETPDEANEEFTKEAANLVLKRLQKDIERGEVDQELLDDLGWTEEQMKKFLERMQQNLDEKPDDDSPQAKARRRQFEEMLKNLNLTEKTQRRDDTNKDKQTGDGIGPVRRPPPPEYREAYESFTKGLSKKKAAETPKK